MKRNKYGVFSACLSGNVREAMELAQKEGSALSAKNRRDLEKLERRFGSRRHAAPIRSEDPVVRAVVRCYRAHYHDVLMRPVDRGRNSRALLELLKRDVAPLIPRLSSARNVEKAEAILKRALLDRGYYSLLGEIGPHRSLSVWRRQSDRLHTIQLPEGQVHIKVVGIDDLIEHGWMSYATFGKFYSGGWVPDSREAIYYVEKAYRRRKGKFKVSILAHEGQHALDLKKFPKLSQCDLEYRAKLVELTKDRRPGMLLQKFCCQTGNDRSNPHAFAARILKSAFSDGFDHPCKGKFIAERADTLLKKHTAMLKSAGARNVRSVI